MLEFSRTINLDLSNYDEDGACKYRCWCPLTSPPAAPPPTVHLPILLIVKSLRAVLFSLSLSPGPVLLDEFVEWYKDKQMS